MTHAHGVGILALGLLLVAGQRVAAQDTASIDHAKLVVDRLVHEQFEDVTKEFTGQMTAALPAAQLRTVWGSLLQQVGAFTSILDSQVRQAPGGITAVVIGCQFERAALNAIVAFDAEAHIAGLNFVPRPVPAAAPPGASRFIEEPMTVGTGEWALPGTLSLPTGSIVAAIVLVHGSGPQDRDETIGPNKPFQDLAWGLANRGVAVLRYEKRTRQYAGRMAAVPNLTVQQETTDDALAAVAVSLFLDTASAGPWLRALPRLIRRSPASSSWPVRHGRCSKSRANRSRTWRRWHQQQRRRARRKRWRH